MIQSSLISFYCGPNDVKWNSFIVLLKILFLALIPRCIIAAFRVVLQGINVTMVVFHALLDIMLSEFYCILLIQITNQTRGLITLRLLHRNSWKPQTNKEVFSEIPEYPSVLCSTASLIRFVIFWVKFNKLFCMMAVKEQR